MRMHAQPPTGRAQIVTLTHESGARRHDKRRRRAPDRKIALRLAACGRADVEKLFTRVAEPRDIAGDERLPR